MHAVLCYYLLLCIQHRKDMEEAKTHVTDDPLALLTKEDLAVTVSQLLLPNETVLKAIKRYAKKDTTLSEQERTANKAAFEVYTYIHIVYNTCRT
jgi:hypothetical protein